MLRMLTQRPALAPADARLLLAESSTDPLAHVAVALSLVAGLRPDEVEDLRVTDYEPSAPRLTTGAEREPRTIQIAPTARQALDAYLAAQKTDSDHFLLPQLRRERVMRIVRNTAVSAGVTVGMYALRQAAIRAALEGGAPVEHVHAYFGFKEKDALPAVEESPLPEGWDAEIAAVLEEAFVS
ncbi:hypothetical protein [Streptomyces inhibens]|uniref:hypothetical protein n=1 Tax=Streptomyces inhibens TaxID=2293571 RepID=UPI001EE70174|nr:hypothetical protein [Streptomyces inhibens]UKY54266.1 hypothetical protein KI385_39285 [Streptomyces inhibens]